jgi:type VI protein secretion system component VasF
MRRITNRAEIDRFLDKMIKTSDKAPPGLAKKLKSATTKKAKGLDNKLRKKGIALPFLLIGIGALVLVIVYFVFLRRPLETDTSIEGQNRDFDEMR